MRRAYAIIVALVVLLAASLTAQENNGKPSAAEEIHAAAAAGDLNRVRALLEADPTLLESKDDLGLTPLMSACWGGTSNNRQLTDAVANYLIDKGANINARNEGGATPLYFATKSFDLTRRLIDLKADVDVRAYVDYTPLHEAAFIGNLEVAKLLIDHGADVNFHGAIGTVLQKVIYNKAESGTEMAKLLIESGARLQGFSYGNTELHLAVLRDYAEIIPLLVKHGADVNAVNEYGHTPLYYAALHGHRKAAEALIAAGANKSAIVETNYGKASQLSAALKEGEAYLWYLGGGSPCDGYAVKTKNHLLIFNPSGISDSPEAGLANGYINPIELAGLKITVLIDHRSGDAEHAPTISALAKAMPSASFVLNFKPAVDNMGNSPIPTYRLATPNESFSMDGFTVHTIPAMLHTFFDSESLGYLVEADGVKIFHAGLYVSDNDSSNVAKYRKEINFLKPFGPIDIAILPISGRHIQLAYEPYLYLIDQLSPKAIYLIGDDLTKEEHRKCIEVLRARNVPVAYPEGGIAVGERFHYLRNQASTAPQHGADCDSPHVSSLRSSYLEERACFCTKLIRRGPAPGSQNQPTPPAGIETVTYASGDLNLRAWLSVPDAARMRPAPALVFFHGGSEQNAFFVEQAKAFRDAGFVLLFPMLRGENGNPGEWESLMGEIDDAAAAVRWIAAQPFVDPARIYTYGHSTGAAVSLLLSVRGDVPVRLGGSSAGLYTEDSLKGWTNAPFDVNDARERRMRTPINFIQTMGHRHVAFVGRDEYSVERVAEFRRLSAGSRLEIREVDGDHMGCLQPALAQFFEIVKSDAAMNQTGALRVGAVPVASPDARRSDDDQFHYRILHHFTGGAKDGASPILGTLTRSGTTLYGMTTRGGESNIGTVFKVNADGSGFAVLHAFMSSSCDGSRPYGSLLLSGSTLYGMAASENTPDSGTIFRIETDGSGFRVLHTFTGNEGKWPYDTLIQSGEQLYGMTTYGAGPGDGGGSIFRMNTDGTGFQLLHTFSRGNGDRWAPHGSLLLAGSTLVGTTLFGGAADAGTVFRLNLDGTGFRLMHTFSGGASDGSGPYGTTLTQVGSAFWGMTRAGGSSGEGTLFRINADGSRFQVVRSFGSTNNEGKRPMCGTLARGGGHLYGMTLRGGTNNLGSIFQVAMDGADFKTLHSFAGDTADGALPYGSLLLSGATLYGMTSEGGSNNLGVIFALDEDTHPITPPSAARSFTASVNNHRGRARVFVKKGLE